MDGSDPPPKRRRLDRGYQNSPGARPPIGSPTESSSDELAAASDYDEHRRASWTMAKRTYTPKRPARRAPPQQPSGSESPDELAIDADVYWRRSTREPPRVRTRRRSPSVHRPDGGDDDDDDDDEDEGHYDSSEPYRGPTGGDGAADDMDAAPIARTPTPLPPPPQPEWVNYKEKFLLKGHLRAVSAVQFSPDGSMIASGGADGAVKVWDTTTGKLIHTFEGHLAGISTIAWNPDGALIASGSDDKSIRLWNVLSGKAHPVPFIGHHNYVYQIAFSPKGNILASGSYDEAVFLWDVRSARVMRSLPAHSDPVAGIDVVRDGTLVVSCAWDGLIRIWDTATGQCLRTLVHEDNPPVTAVKFSPNGKFVLAWTLDDCVRLWDYVEGRCLKTYQGHINRKYSISGGFGSYGAPGITPAAFAVSGSEDGTIICWDVVSKKVFQRIEGHTDVVLGVDTCTFENKRYMVSCGMDQTIKVWQEKEGGKDGEEGIDQTGVDAPQPEAHDSQETSPADQTPMTGQTSAETTTPTENPLPAETTAATDPSSRPSEAVKSSSNGDTIPPGDEMVE
ncbi:hypothetical protein ASPZODRAFT_69717 [Penicilliopsis zonata CBS 506.65]|uniref:Mitochondrial division protein 1 n=1 Tax=Penicilliopsis zonata CBS 506.65 TaxID=1073090 RepID=A0A1L9SDZ3_9EURO|nr:hypothetical protein ASPZODRAFT_69717 [Penicilliopsis zonata CBS 506.65]OJJ45399.1 hypothetical protein ASPZODRAFT_69717 [Penicilliopsis zonata CBS 506.65]